MYSIPDNLDSTEFSGWINQDLLLKDSRRATTTTRKRNYELANVDLEEQCDDLRRRVLRPRQTVEPQSSGASRTRPIRSNRGRRRQLSPGDSNDYHQRLLPTNQEALEPPPAQPQTSVFIPDVTTQNSSANDLSFFQALASYYWPQNYLVAHSDPSIIHRVQPPSPYPHMNNIHLSQQMPHFDPWILHNYLLASSNYSNTGSSHVSSESTNDESSRNMSQLGYPSITQGNSLANNFIWQYPFLLNPAFNPLQSQGSRPLELGQNVPTSSRNVESNRYLLTNSSQRSVPANSNDPMITERVPSGMYTSDAPPIINYPDHNILPNPFSYGSLCPYHNTSHIIHHSQLSPHHMATISSNLSEPIMQPHSYSAYPHSPDNYWQRVTTQSMRPANYPINSSNIDTLLHLAAHFEQRKRGITRDELDKLPTHRFKTASERSKRAKICPDKVDDGTTDDSQKCLVCLDEFESKQSIRTLGCQHEFHAKCIDKWLKINRSCPLCRADAFDGTAQKDGA